MVVVSRGRPRGSSVVWLHLLFRLDHAMGTSGDVFKVPTAGEIAPSSPSMLRGMSFASLSPPAAAAFLAVLEAGEASELLLPIPDGLHGAEIRLRWLIESSSSSNMWGSSPCACTVVGRGKLGSLREPTPPPIVPAALSYSQVSTSPALTHWSEQKWL